MSGEMTNADPWYVHSPLPPEIAHAEPGEQAHMLGHELMMAGRWLVGAMFMRPEGEPAIAVNKPYKAENGAVVRRTHRATAPLFAPEVWVEQGVRIDMSGVPASPRHSLEIVREYSRPKGSPKAEPKHTWLSDRLIFHAPQQVGATDPFEKLIYRAGGFTPADGGRQLVNGELTAYSAKSGEWLTTYLDKPHRQLLVDNIHKAFPAALQKMVATLAVAFEVCQGELERI